jgi:hypothetical protein
VGLVILFLALHAARTSAPNAAQPAASTLCLTNSCRRPCPPTHPGLCDEVPTCLYSRIETFSGTSLIDSINSLDQGKGGCSRAVLLACLASLGLLCLA